MSNELKDYPVQLQIPVAWGDMDAFKHVNNINYFRYFESSRILYFDKIGFDSVLKNNGVGPILAAIDCKYIFPLTYPDTITVGCRAHDLATDNFLMSYLVWSERHKRVAAIGKSKIVGYDYTKFCKADFAPEIMTGIREIEG